MAQQTPDRPNIVFVLADDMGIGDLSCYNHESKITTANMDAAAGDGMVFTDAHSASAVCTPSRYGILTGRYCWRTDLSFGVYYGYEPPLIEQGRQTLPELLRAAGYHTACIGKWHLGLGYSTNPGTQVDFSRALPWNNATREQEEKIDFSRGVADGPIDRGFDYFFGNSGCPTCQPPYGFIEQRDFIELPTMYHETPVYTSRPGMMAPSWKHKDVDTIIARHAVDYIESRADKPEPFFLYLAPSACHEPCTEEVIPEFARGKSQAGPRGDMVWLFDWVVGEVMKALEKAGKADDTLLVVTSDNGALPGDRLRGPDGKDHYRTYDHLSSDHWRGYKSHIWEGGHREPLIVRWPGHVKAGSRFDGLTGLNDFMATCASLVNVPLADDAGEDSEDMLPVLLGDAGESAGRSSLIHHSGRGVFSIRAGQWKLVHESQGSGGWPPPTGTRPVAGSPGQLFDLANDPGETRDLFEEKPGVVKDLTDLLLSMKRNDRTASPR